MARQTTETQQTKSSPPLSKWIEWKFSVTDFIFGSIAIGSYLPAGFKGVPWVNILPAAVPGFLLAAATSHEVRTARRPQVMVFLIAIFSLFTILALDGLMGSVVTQQVEAEMWMSHRGRMIAELAAIALVAIAATFFVVRSHSRPGMQAGEVELPPEIADKIAVLENDKNNLLQIAGIKEDEVKQANADKTLAEKRRDVLEADLTAAQKSLAIAIEDSKEWKNRYEDAQQSIAEKSTKIEKLEKEKKELAENVDSLQKQIDVRQERAALRLQFAAWVKKLAEFRARYETDNKPSEEDFQNFRTEIARFAQENLTQDQLTLLDSSAGVSLPAFVPPELVASAEDIEGQKRKNHWTVLYLWEARLIEFIKEINVP